MSAEMIVPGAGGGRAGGRLARLLAIALLPASIVPVCLLGPALLRAPQRLWREAAAEVARLQAHPSGGRRAPGVRPGSGAALLRGRVILEPLAPAPLAGTGPRRLPR